MISNLRFVVDGCLQESDSVFLRTPKEVHRYWRNHIACDATLEEHKEHLTVLMLNTKNVVIGHTVVSTGTVSECLAAIRDILRPVIVGGGKSFILIHNHPSSDTTPSGADTKLTKKLEEAASLMDLSLQDHVIVSRKGYYSFREHGVI